MPFGSYEKSNEQAIENAQRFVKEAGCDAVKLERGGASVDRARAIVRSGIPVMGHVGLTPQTATALGGFKAQGRTAEAAAKLCEEALALQSVGCFAIVFEAIPSAVTEALMPKLEIPVIGIGAGPSTDGQVLVLHDLLGVYDGHQPKFVKRFAEVREESLKGVRAYTEEVRAGPSRTRSSTPTRSPRRSWRSSPATSRRRRWWAPTRPGTGSASTPGYGRGRPDRGAVVEASGNSRAVCRRRISTPTTASAARTRTMST